MLYSSCRQWCGRAARKFHRGGVHEIQISKQIFAMDMGDDGKSIIRFDANAFYCSTKGVSVAEVILHKNFIGTLLSQKGGGKYCDVVIQSIISLITSVFQLALIPVISQSAIFLSGKPDARNKFYLDRNRHHRDKNPCFVLSLDCRFLFSSCPGDAVPQSPFRWNLCCCRENRPVRSLECLDHPSCPE